MTEIWLREDKLPTPLPVILSPTINYEINEIEYLNWRKTDEIHKWHDYLDRVLRYISNPSIAWDYAGRYRHLPNGETYINEIGYDVGFIIEANDTQTYVNVFRLALNAEEYGLQMSTNEGRKYNNTHKQYDIMNNKKTKIRLTESQLHNIIKESVKNLLKEETYEFDDTQLFPQAVELAIELSDALRKIKIDTYGEKTVCIPIHQFSYIEDMSSQLHEIMHQLEEQSTFPRN